MTHTTATPRRALNGIFLRTSAAPLTSHSIRVMYNASQYSRAMGLFRASATLPPRWYKNGLAAVFPLRNTTPTSPPTMRFRPFAHYDIIIYTYIMCRSADSASPAISGAECVWGDTNTNTIIIYYNNNIIICDIIIRD